MTCPENQVRYQARHSVAVAGYTMQPWEVRCLPATHEVAELIRVDMLVAEVDGTFPDPVVIPRRCCGQS